MVDIINCNKVISGRIEIKENELNIKYGINGVGKTTIAKAIKFGVEEPTRLKELVPFGTDLVPEVQGLDGFESVEIFNEAFVNQFVFNKDSVINNAFEVFIVNDRYNALMDNINTMLSSIKREVELNEDIKNVLAQIESVQQNIKLNAAKTSLAGTSVGVKALNKGNKIAHIPTEIHQYKSFLTNEANNYNWLEWQKKGKDFLCDDKNCPFCTNGLNEAHEKSFELLDALYEKNGVKVLTTLKAIFGQLSTYLSEKTNSILNLCINNPEGIQKDKDLSNFLVKFMVEMNQYGEQIKTIKEIGYYSLKDVEKISDKISLLKIKKDHLEFFTSDVSIEIIDKINNLLDEVNTKAIALQAETGKLNSEVKKVIQKNKLAINRFLSNAGFDYELDLQADTSNNLKTILYHKESKYALKDINMHLSWGERNAFALVLFMYHVLHKKPSLIILDDPISSFDDNKKYSIIYELFRNSTDNLYNKTVLMMTHDFTPVIDFILNNKPTGGKVNATNVVNNGGNLSEVNIEKDDLKSIIEVSLTSAKNVSLNKISRLTFLRRYLELINHKHLEYCVLSSLFKARSHPTHDRDGVNPLAPEHVEQANTAIQEFVEGFEYHDLLNTITTKNEIVSLYQSTENSYEKLQLFRIILDVYGLESKISDNIVKFIDEAFHIENDLLYQLNPYKYNLVPLHITTACDTVIERFKSA